MAARNPWPKLRDPETWRGRSLEEHARGIEAACRGAMQILADCEDRQRRLAQSDPVPPSTRALLRRLAQH